MIFIILALIIAVLVMKHSNKKLKKDSEKNISDLKVQLNLSEITIKEKDDLIDNLSKYKGIIDVEKKCNELLSDAQTESDKIIKDAKDNAALLKSRCESIIEFANVEAKKIKNDSLDDKKKIDQQIKSKKAEYEEIITNSIEQSKKIIADANEKAKDIAGEAYYAMQNYKDLEKKAKAMKNVVDGYGNEYIIPTSGILDELADDFGYTEAGTKLKAARDKTKLMVQNGLAAKCDYVETNRKYTAINFVTDAFNGKVDSILSTAKSTNYGILEQKIKDAFILVNNLGEAFRNAVITDEYLQSRLDELKWTVAVFELKEKEKEEQRAIKEQMREEEKARREYEKAMKEAEKEEALLKKLMEKAQAQLKEANAQQRAKYEEQLQDLQNKLQEAQEKNQKALSMAQQTKSGNVYIISNIGSFGENVYKIGMTRRLEPLDRINELSNASVPFSFDVHSMIFSEDAPKLENELHKIFDQNRVNKVNNRKEFFKVSLKDIKAKVEKMGIETKWTMVAEAAEYKESLAIEKQDLLLKEAILSN